MYNNFDQTFIYIIYVKPLKVPKNKVNTYNNLIDGTLSKIASREADNVFEELLMPPVKLNIGPVDSYSSEDNLKSINLADAGVE
jgi:hypothetical protein